MKIAIALIADPQQGEEALARAFNAMAVAAEAHERGDEVSLLFIGTGTRWPAQLSKLGHPAHALYQAVRPLVAGASCGCAAVFGATESVRECGVPEIKDNPIPGTPGLASLRHYAAAGYQTLVF